MTLGHHAVPGMTRDLIKNGPRPRIKSGAERRRGAIR